MVSDPLNFHNIIMFEWGRKQGSEEKECEGKSRRKSRKAGRETGNMLLFLGYWRLAVIWIVSILLSVPWAGGHLIPGVISVCHVQFTTQYSQCSPAGLYRGVRWAGVGESGQGVRGGVEKE